MCHINFFQLFCSFSVVSLLMYTLIILYNCRVCEHNGMYHIFILPISFNKNKKYFSSWLMFAGYKFLCVGIYNQRPIVGIIYSTVRLRFLRLTYPPMNYDYRSNILQWYFKDSEPSKKCIDFFNNLFHLFFLLKYVNCLQ